MSGRGSRWARLPLRTKGLIVVALPVLPLMFFCLITVIPLIQYGVAGRARDLPAQQRHVAAVAQVIVLVGSAAFALAGLVAAAAIGNSVRRRIELLATHAARLADGPMPDDLPLGDDEVGDLGRELRDVGRLLKERNDDLRLATRSLDRFFHLSNDMFAIAGFDGYFKQLNPAWERTLGIPTAELLAKPFLEWIHPDDRAATEATSPALLQGADVLSFENRYRCLDGSYRWLLWMARAALDEQRIYASARDVTAQRADAIRQAELHVALERQTTALQATNQELEAFSYSVSHDLRAPLRAIDGFSQVIEEEHGLTLGPSGQDALRRIRTAAKRMAMLIDDLLNLSRLARMEMQRGRLDLSAIASSIVVELRRQTPDRQVSVQIAPGLLAYADTRMMRIVLQNLIDNAWKYTGRTPNASIEVGTTMRGDAVAYTVRDNGAGFDMRYVDKLFGAFQRLHSDRDFQGTGIGLAIVQRIVHRHGGEVWAEGAVGAGATFGFTLGSDKGPS